MKIKRKELQCVGGKVTVEEFHDGYRMHIAVIAERLPAPRDDEYDRAYREAGIPIKADRREIRFSLSDRVLTSLVARGELPPDADIISALQVLARAAWAHKNDAETVWPFQTYVWGQDAANSASTYGFGFSGATMPPESFD